MVAFGLRGVRCSYGDRPALEIDEIEIEPGQAAAILGPNGSGKTTLLSTLGLLHRPDAGELTVLGERAYGSDFDPVPLRRRISYVMQRPFLFNRTIGQNLRIALRLRGSLERESGPRVGAALERVGLAGFEDRKAAELSAGQTARAAIARALVSDPEALILDEPTASLDAATCQVIERVAAEFTREGRTFIFATHDASLALRVAGKVVYLQEGRVSRAPLDNYFVGRIEPNGSGFRFRATSGLEIQVTEGRPGRTTAAIDPAHILLSREPLHSSARNVYRGRVSSLEEIGPGRVRLRVDAGAPFIVHVTSRSVAELSLHPGDEVYLTFKASSVVLS